MNTVDRYISLALMKGWTIVMMVLAAIFGLLAFVGELDHVSSRYSAIDALAYVGGTLPQIVLELSPVIALLGSLIALAGLARHSEIIAIRAAGVSSRRLLKSVSFAALGLVVALSLFGEFVASPTQQAADQQRTAQRSGKGNLLKGKGLWLNDGDRYFNVRRLRRGAVPSNVSLYDFDENGNLTEFIHATRAQAKKDRTWTIYEAMHKEFKNGALATARRKTMNIGPFWAPSELPVIRLATSAMPLTDMYDYIGYLESAGQRTDRLKLSFWQKASLPFSAGLMVFLALPIGASLSSQRSGAFAKRIGLGAIIGIVFYLLTQIIHTAGLISGLPALLVAAIPLVLTLTASVLLIRKMR